MTLLIGIPACARAINGTVRHVLPAHYGAALFRQFGDAWRACAGRTSRAA